MLRDAGVASRHGCGDNSNRHWRVGLPAVARRLVIAWNALNLKTSMNLQASTFVTYDHERGFSAVISTIDALQESYLP
jgi:hypothetical protein